MDLRSTSSTLLWAAMALTFSACSANHNEPTVRALTPDSSVIEQSLDDKGQAQPSAERKELLRAKLEQRQALLELAEQSSRIDLKKIDAHIAKIRSDMVLSEYFEALYAENVTEQAVAAYYESNAEHFTVEEQELAHILIKVPSGASEEERAVAQTRAQEILGKLHSGEKFSDVAAEYSEDQRTLEIGGRLGWVSPGTVAEAIYSGGSTLETGAVSQPVVAPYGLHIIKKMGSARQRQLPIERVRARIEKQLRAGIKQAEVERLTDEKSS